MAETVSVSKRGDEVWVMTLQGNGEEGRYENTFNPEFIRAIHAALDKVQNESKGSAACLVTCSSGKFFSNGLDLGWLMEQEIGGEVQLNFLRDFHKLLFRVLTFPMPTVAAINGHAFAGGWLFALAHDYRVMNSEKGYACMTEIDIGATLTPPLNALIKEKLSRRLAAQMMLQGCRLSANELFEEKAIDMMCPQAEVFINAVSIGEKW
eukprot:CAMPEP_0184052576 /NCGR_PEP_ID=MMETSP0956-20121227/5386_1 /TAXON_ID=627963 /ORGANISM="Aplanochytrium sp, Strain PBS07" /LENGTH=207 /DNA_ID=CAMNT_0026345681 /DNA_START=5 /DNA_END=625 /DNA_ORIENTATION=+